VRETWGGVGHNIALCLGQLDIKPVITTSNFLAHIDYILILGWLQYFVTVVGSDSTGESFTRHCKKSGIRSDGVLRAEGR
jgi:hypothetical protein